jgi:RNA polymerase sigma factor (sigma-70 family)
VSPRLSDLLLSSQSDERLVSLARAGHERAFATIVERYAPELQALARRLCSDGRSEDIVQQAFLSAFAALRSGCEVRHLRGWLYRIVRNTAGRAEAPTLVPLDGTTASGSVLEDVVQQRAMAMTALSEIARLPARQRQAMVGTALDGRPRAEVANSMGLSEGAVRQLVHRARRTLRGAVTALTPWPLARWLVTAGPDTPGPGELAAGAGAASSGGLALKLGALLASGTLLTGAAVHLQARPAHPSGARGATPVHPRRVIARTQPVAVASVAPPLLARAASPGPAPRSRPAGPSRSVSRPASPVGAPLTIVRRERHDGASIGSGLRSEGAPVGHDDGGRDGGGDRSDPGRSSGGGGGDGAGARAGASSPTSSGSGTSTDGHGQSGGGPDGSGTDGGDGSSGSSGTGTGSGDGAAQLVAASQPLDSVVDGSDSRQGSDGGSGSQVGTSSDGGSGSGGGGTSGD